MKFQSLKLVNSCLPSSLIIYKKSYLFIFATVFIKSTPQRTWTNFLLKKKFESSLDFSHNFFFNGHFASFLLEFIKRTQLPVSYGKNTRVGWRGVWRCQPTNAVDKSIPYRYTRTGKFFHCSHVLRNEYLISCCFSGINN